MSIRAFLLPAVANAFQELRLCVAVREGGPWRIGEGGGWRSIHVQKSVADFEIEHGREIERDRYNVRCMAQVRRTRAPVRGEHAGLLDLFVPVVVGGQVAAIVAAGPFARARPSGAEMLERWRWLTGRQGHPADPEFAYYASLSLATLVLDGKLLFAFERFASCFAQLLGEPRDSAALLAEADSLRAELIAARLAEDTWDAVRSMVDERTAHTWSSPYRRSPLRQLGLAGVPERALVGLMVPRPETDPVDELVQRDGLQRACVALARSIGNVVAGQVGDYGVVFLAPDAGSASRARQRMLAIGDKAATLARRRFRFSLYLGLSTLSASAPLGEHYQAALGAAEAALSRGLGVVESGALPRATQLLHELRRQLAKLVEQKPEELPARFERYAEAVALHCGYQLEPSRGHLEAGFEDLAAALLDGGALDRKTYVETSAGLAKAAREARTLAEISAVYRRVIADMSDAAKRPLPARRDRGLGRALSYVHRHYAEPLYRDAVAHVAGFAPSYFSALFKRQQRTTFERYVRSLRIERAKQLLAGTDLGLRRVAELSGFRTRFYLGEVFKRAVGMTPLAWRTASGLRIGGRKR